MILFNKSNYESLIGSNKNKIKKKFLVNKGNNSSNNGKLSRNNETISRNNENISRYNETISSNKEKLSRNNENSTEALKGHRQRNNYLQIRL